MPTSNPALSERVFTREMEGSPNGGRSATAFAGSSSWAAPTTATTDTAGTGPAPHRTPPAGTTDDDAMRVGGVASATAIFGAVLFLFAAFGWNAVGIETAKNVSGETVVTSTHIPGWLWPAMIVGLVLAIITIFKPKIARYTGVLYAAAEGLFLGAISKIFNVTYSGIVVQALGLTVAVFLIMLVLFATGAIRVTNKLRLGIIVATGAVFVVYLLTWILQLTGIANPLIFSSGPLGIGFSLVVVGIAAFNLLLDFDFVQRAVEAKAPRYMEWYAAFGLMITLVWLYLELLRLLAKLRS